MEGVLTDVALQCETMVCESYAGRVPAVLGGLDARVMLGCGWVGGWGG